MIAEGVVCCSGGCLGYLVSKLMVRYNYKQNIAIQTDLKKMDKTRTLQALLRCHDIPAQEFFQTQGIAQQIRNNLDRFIKYCRTHRPFARRMITLALNVHQNELEDLTLKTAAHAITEVLANEEAAIAELFFEEEQQKNESADIPEELEGGIQSEAQRLFQFDDDQDQPQQQRPVELEKEELVALSLEILREPERNNTCLGHLHKLFSFLIRHNPLPVLHYFSQHNDALQLLLSNLRYSSISSLVAQLLTSEDKTRLYTYEGLKRSIIQHAIEEMFAKIEDEDFFDGVMILVEEILNTTKQSYYEYFEDFKRVSNLLVNHDIMKRFLDVILSHNEKSFRSASRFLEFLFARINSERQDNSYYHRGEETEPSMNFQVDIYYQNVPALMETVTRVEKFNSLTKISYLSFLQALLASAKFKIGSFSLSQPGFIGLLDCLNRQQKAGIFKNKLYSILSSIIAKSSEEQISKFLTEHDKIWQSHFTCVKAANYSNTKVYNKNQSSAYDVSLINQLSKKNEGVIGNASRALGKDFKRICKKYETKIASFQSSSSFSLEEESTFEQFNFESSRVENNNSSVPSFSLNFVGKNSISIPILQLPQRNHSEQESKERGERQEHLSLNGIKEIIEVEEVVSLTDTIKSLTFNDREEFHIERPPELSRDDKLSESPERPEQPKEVEKEKPAVVEVLSKIKVESKPESKGEKIRFYAKYLQIFA